MTKFKIGKVFMALVLILGLSACSASKNVSGDSETPDASENALINEEASISEEVTTPEKEVRPIRDISSVELIKEIKAGWNLGNTLDASGGAGLNTETSWGNPKTSFEMMTLLKETGFDAVRLPVTWYKHIGTAPDYLIDEEWLDRVEEIVNYALDNDLYCILNTHHEEWLFPDEEHEAQNAEELSALWAQIAERFKNYDERLIFEGMNEPRLRDTPNEWNGGTEEAWGVINRLNAVFVKTVRETGGNNALRHLMITGHAASGERKVLESIALIPNDDKIIISVHAYTPWAFALNTKGATKFSSEKEGSRAPIETLFADIKDVFLDKNVAVIIGETGALDKDNLDYRVDWAGYYFGQGRDFGVPCFWWDNGEKFGLMNRAELTWAFEEIVEQLTVDN